MLQYKNHRLYYNDFSFAIPNNYFLNPEAADCGAETVYLVSDDMRYLVELSLQFQTRGAGDELAHVILDLGCPVLEAMAPFSINGLDGYCATYTSGGDYYHELHLDLEDSGEGMTEFVVVIRTEDVIESKNDVADIISKISPMREG